MQPISELILFKRTEAQPMEFEMSVSEQSKQTKVIHLLHKLIFAHICIYF